MLSKSDFKIASTCSKKLIYKKANYKTRNDANEYLENLAQGGHIIGKYAQLLFPNGIEIKSNTIEEAISETKQLLAENDNITLFEATFLSNGKIVRTDILEKKNNVFNIIEVKSKSHDSTNSDNRTIPSDIIEDLAYQSMVVKEVYPDVEVHSFLLLPDKSKQTTIEGLAGWFEVNTMVEEKFEMDELPAQNTVTFKKPLVEFKYENHPDRDKYIDLLVDDNLLALFPLDKEINEMMDVIRLRSNHFIDILYNGIKPEHYDINKNCKDCEFNLGHEQDNNGYRECWNELADVDPHIFDLYFGGAIGNNRTGWYLDELISQKKISFEDLDVERFKDSKGNFGPRGQRQLLQYENTKTKSEWLSLSLKENLDKLQYPLHFIDFETYQSPIPHHKGMRPYEKVAFQWSCHTIESRGSSELLHSEFINSEYDFPNFRFAESLMNQIGTTGTPLMWSSFENTILRNILEQMDRFSYKNDNLKDWLTNITTDNTLGRSGRFVDMNDLTFMHYFHPDMKGKTSIKKVLPAVWKNNIYLHSNPWFKKYASDAGTSLNPYDTLAPIISELEKEEVVKDGTGAMRAYHNLMFGEQSNSPEKREQLIKLLLQYCELDTMAMVIIWKYWMDKCGLS